MDEKLNILIHDRIQTCRSLIKTTFNDLVKKWKNCNGFIGFEDMEGMISILFSHNEKFFHMKATDGFTGWVYSKGKAEIYVPGTHRKHLEKPSKNMDSAGFSEMVATIKYTDNDHKEEYVGVILIDKYTEPGFTKKDLELLSNAASNISGILSNVDPWNLRNWWQMYESVCTERYQKSVEDQLISKLGGDEGVSLSTQLYKAGKLSSPIEISEMSYSRRAGRTVSEEVLLTGTCAYDPASLTQGILGVPFPTNGPIRGVISVIRSEPHENEQEEKIEVAKIEEAVTDVIESTEYPLFKEVFDTEDAGVKMFSILSRCNSNDLSLERSLAEVCNDFGSIDNAKIELFLSPIVLSDDQSQTSTNLHVMSQKELEKEFHTKDNRSFRPRYWTSKNQKHQQLRCGIFIGRKLVGGIKSTPHKEELSQAALDGPIIEVFSTFLSKLLSKVEKSRILNLLLNRLVESDVMDVGEFLQSSISVLECNYFGIIVFKSKGEISSMNIKDDHQTDGLAISEAKMESILSKLDLKQDHLNINNTEDGLKELGIPDVEELREELNQFEVRSFMIKRVDQARMLIAVTHRERSFKRFFDREDRDNMAVLALLFKLRFEL